MNIKQLMKQAQLMQNQMQEMKAKMDAKEFEGKSGGGLVSITMFGSGEMKKASIDPSLLDINEQEMLEDLIVAAHNEAKSKADEESKNNMSGALGDMSGLAGMKF